MTTYPVVDEDHQPSRPTYGVGGGGHPLHQLLNLIGHVSHHARRPAAIATTIPAKTTIATRPHPACGSTPIQRAARSTSAMWAPRSHGGEPLFRLPQGVGTLGRSASQGATPVHKAPPTAAHGRPAAPLSAAHPRTAARPTPAVGAQLPPVSAAA